MLFCIAGRPDVAKVATESGSSLRQSTQLGVAVEENAPTLFPRSAGSLQGHRGRLTLFCIVVYHLLVVRAFQLGRSFLVTDVFLLAAGHRVSNDRVLAIASGESTGRLSSEGPAVWYRCVDLEQTVRPVKGGLHCCTLSLANWLPDFAQRGKHWLSQAKLTCEPSTKAADSFHKSW